ncbi:probable transcriptional regulator SLK2 [Salvia miltiorrhiza]|uniref:probable transcriptional regulator SLK2 n=1 Tax=Salvia miltiorrhiza TaxID=226208 RepID=UPI0025AC3F55|nr:probable transcriptional regulator SLK2 [Salvia miltiorrhiza]XP_057774402.1 probable transcriptional regulator SLK2 [Salvia miltiorrhiza]
MVPSRVAGGTAQSSSSSGIFFQEDGQGQVPGNSQFSSNFRNSSTSLPGHAQAQTGPFSGDVSNTVLNSLASSGPSVGASSLVTDANSGLSGGPHLQRSASVNTESYMRLPASPMSFSSNNISISGSSVMDGSSVVQQSSNQDPGSQHTQQNQQHHGVSSATSLPRMGQVQFHGGARVHNSLAQDQTTMSQLQKKPRLDIKQEDVVQQQVLQQLLQRQDSMHLQNSNPQLQALIQQQRLRQQEQQILQAMPPLQRVQLLQQQQQLQLRQQLQMQGMPSAIAVKRPYDGGVCSRRLMQYLYHQRQRPADNTIAYWRKFVAEYYSPRAKKRWCLSLYNNVGHHSLGVFPQAAMDAWQCDICGSKSGRGFEATFEVLPRLNEIKFASGVIDELLFLDLPRESRFPSGIMMLEYAKAVQESVYEQLRVVREGHLRIFFTPDLKILSWEFCARHHEELLPRRFVAPQVNQLLQVAQKCQSTISESGADGVSQPDLQANSAMVLTAGRQLARSLELQSLNDLGFSKRYVRCLQIADVVNSMKDLMDFCRDQKKGPIEGLNSFPRCSAVPRVQMQETDQMGGLQGLPTDRNALNKLMALHPGLNSQHAGSRGGGLTGSAHSGFAMNNYQNFLMRQNSMNSNNSVNQHDGSSPFNTCSQPLPTTPGSSGALPGMFQNPQMSSFSGSQAPQQQQNGLIKQSQPLLSQNNQTLQHQMIQQFLHDMSKKNNGGAVMQQTYSIQNPGNCISAGGLGNGIRNSPPTSAAGNAQAQPPSRSNSFKAASFKTESPASVGHMGYGQKSSYYPETLHTSDEMVPDIAHQFIENGFFNNDLDESMNFSWKG